MRCAISVTSGRKSPRRTGAAPPTRAPANGLCEQEAPENSLVEFSSHSTEYALVELGDAIGSATPREKGIVLEWAPFRIGQQVWQYGFLPGGEPKDLTLPFATIWRTTSTPAAKDRLHARKLSAGKATVPPATLKKVRRSQTEKLKNKFSPC